MDSDDLILSAKKLQQVSTKSASEFGAKKDLLVEQMNVKMLNRSDIIDMVGADNLEMMKDNHANHARFLESLFIHHSPETLVDTILWVFRAYRSRNFKSTYWAAQLNTWIELYKIELTKECYEEIYPYYNWMQINIPTFNNLAEGNLETTYSAH